MQQVTEAVQVARAATPATTAGEEQPGARAHPSALLPVIKTICFQFPDPHFKKKHKKRRVVNDLLVDTLGRLLPYASDHLSGSSVPTEIFLQSDVQEVCESMAECFFDSPYFEPVAGQDTVNLSLNPSPHAVATEREHATLSKSVSSSVQVSSNIDSDGSLHSSVSSVQHSSSGLVWRLLFVRSTVPYDPKRAPSEDGQTVRNATRTEAYGPGPLSRRQA